MMLLITAILKIWWPTHNHTYANDEGDNRPLWWVLSEKKASVMMFLIAYLFSGLHQYSGAADLIDLVHIHGSLKGLANSIGFAHIFSSIMNSIFFVGLAIWAITAFLSKADKALSK